MLSYLAAFVLPAILVRRLYGLKFIGLTGGISSGKSSVTAHLRHVHQLPVLDFDLISREVVQPGHQSGALNRIRKTFGESVMKDDGTLDREALGKVIFSDPSQRKSLDRLMKVPIWMSFFRHVIQLTRQGHREIILDVPLLFEAKMHLLCSETIVVYVDREVQRARLMKRDSISSERAEGKISAQWSLDRKAKLADTVIHNNGSIQELHHQLDHWYKQHLAKEKKQGWWSNWIPTVPSWIAAIIASPILLSLNAFARWWFTS